MALKYLTVEVEAVNVPEPILITLPVPDKVIVLLDPLKAPRVKTSCVEMVISPAAVQVIALPLMVKLE